jgi:DNA polymerase III epsilon subunit-like protein
LDIETTGLEPTQGHTILTIGCIVDTKLKTNPIREYYGVVKPTQVDWQMAAPKALEVNGLKFEDLVANGKPMREAATDFCRFLVENGVRTGNAIVIGQNPTFDLKFLQYYMAPELSYCGFPFGDFRDTRDMYSVLMNRRQVPFLKYRSSEKISEGLGVAPEPWPHNALEGAKAVFRNFSKMQEMLQEKEEEV